MSLFKTVGINKIQWIVLYAIVELIDPCIAMKHLHSFLFLIPLFILVFIVVFSTFKNEPRELGKTCSLPSAAVLGFTVCRMLSGVKRHTRASLPEKFFPWHEVVQKQLKVTN